MKVATVASVGLVSVAILSVVGVALLAYAGKPMPDLLATIAVLAVREIVAVLQSYLRAEGGTPTDPANS